MEKIRGFEIAKGFEDKEINMPVRKTKFSAGYDIESSRGYSYSFIQKRNEPNTCKKQD